MYIIFNHRIELFFNSSGKKIEKQSNFLAGLYMLKDNDRNTRTRCDICQKLTIKTPKRRQWHRFGVFIVNFEHISDLVLLFLLLTLSIRLPAGLTQ